MNLSKLNRVLLQTLLLPVVALMLVSGLLVQQILNSQQTVARSQLADRNLATASLISALIADEESGIRGYQNTSNEIFLQPYELSVGPLQDALSHLRHDMVAQGEDPRPVDELVTAHQHWVSTIAEPMIDLVRNGADTRDPGVNLRGKAYLDRMRELIGSIISSQKQLRDEGVENWRAQIHHTLIAVVGLSLIVGIVIGLFTRSRLHMVSSAFQAAMEALRKNSQFTYESEQRLRATLTSIGDGVIVCDPEGRVELFNTVAQHITGWSADEAFHRHIDEVLPLIAEDTRIAIESPFYQVKRDYRVTGLPSHALLIRHDGSELPVDSSGAPILERDGALAGVVLVFRDITDQRRTQAALMASEKLAVAGRLAATIAHEIHNPLDAVVNLVYLMKSGSSPEDMSKFLDMASAELDRVTHISRAMLGMYRESKTAVAVDLKSVIESVLVLLERQMAFAGITIYTDLAEDALVTGFPAELRQVFTNLLTNASEASISGDSIEIKAYAQQGSRTKKSGTLVRSGAFVTITDHGTGISPEALERLFQPFFTTKGEQGTGLGLWVSQGIIQKHGGTITVDSHTDPERHGTSITVFLPRGQVSLPTLSQ